MEESTVQQKKTRGGLRGIVARSQLSAQCLVEEWHGCEELKPKPKDKLTFVDKKWKLRGIAWSCVDVREEQKEYDDVWKV